MSTSDQKQNVALSSVLAGLALTLMKLVVGLMTGSMGIISEAAHSALDFVAAIMTYFAVRVGDRPADDTHPFGHAKVESVSALIETGLLFLTSFWIVYEAVHRLLLGKTGVEATWYAFVIVILSIIIDISRSRALYKVAKATSSQALEADALHFSSDIYSSAVVLLGLVFIRFGVGWADSVAAIVVSLFVLVAGWRLGKRTISVLVDTAPVETTEKIKAAVKLIPGVISAERIRVRPVGITAFVDVVAKINRKFSVSKAQELINSIEATVRQIVPNADVLVHTGAGVLDNETIVEKVQILASKHNLSVHDVVVDTLDSRKYISFDLEVLDNLTLGVAHEQATKLEEEIIKEMGDGVEVNSHIEPLRHEAILSSDVSPVEMKKIMEIVQDVDDEIQEISDVHNILVRKIDEKFFVSLHCYAPTALSIECIHNASARFEYLIRQKELLIKRVVIHVEPK